MQVTSESLNKKEKLYLLKLPKLYYGKFLKRYKRFLVDIQTSDDVFTIHNPNTGSMKGLIDRENLIVYSSSSNLKRKLKYTLEGINVSGEWIYTNTIAVNKIVEQGILDNEIHEFTDKNFYKREYSYGKSRIDFYIELKSGPKCLVEVKNVTLFDDKYAMFPDAVTSRGTKHLEHLIKSMDEGYTPYVLYVIQVKRKKFKCAKQIDKTYCNKMAEAEKAGVKILKYQNIFDPEEGTCRLVNY